MEQKNTRRRFLGTLASGAAAAGLTTVAPLTAGAHAMTYDFPDEDPEAWFRQLKGKHKMVFDVTQPHEIFPFAWPRVFLLTNELTGTAAKETNAVIVLRHKAIPYALQDELWSTYKLGEAYQIKDNKTGQPALRNPFWKPEAGDYKVPGIGPVAIGINELQESGALFCVCDVALTVNSAAMAAATGGDAARIRADWVKGLLPGIQVVPSGVWAIGRAQERGCAYCFAG